MCAVRRQGASPPPPGLSLDAKWLCETNSGGADWFGGEGGQRTLITAVMRCSYTPPPTPLNPTPNCPPTWDRVSEAETGWGRTESCEPVPACWAGAEHAGMQEHKAAHCFFRRRQLSYSTFHCAASVMRLTGHCGQLALNHNMLSGKGPDGTFSLSPGEDILERHPDRFQVRLTIISPLITIIIIIFICLLEWNS